jgi:stearoyl-CoA desaturase (delta-9 desaturase)
MVGIIVSHAGTAVALYWLLTGQASAWWLLASYAGFILFGLVGVDGGYHRVVAHRSLEARNRLCLGILLALALPAAQGSAMSWASSHRLHHAQSDGPGDPHSPRDGVWHAYMGWMFGDYVRVIRMGLLRDPLLRWQHRQMATLLLGLWVTAGLISAELLVYGLLLPAAWGFFSVGLVNALGHRADQPRNLWWFWPLVGATALHGNHHAMPWRGRYGQPDPIYWVLRALTREPDAYNRQWRGAPHALRETTTP